MKKIPLMAICILLTYPWSASAATPATPISLTTVLVKGSPEIYSVSMSADGNLGVRINLNSVHTTADNLRQCTIIYLDPSDNNGAQKTQLMVTGFVSTKYMQFTIDAMANAGSTYCHAIELSVIK